MNAAKILMIVLVNAVPMVGLANQGEISCNSFVQGQGAVYTVVLKRDLASSRLDVSALYLRGGFIGSGPCAKGNNGDWGSGTVLHDCKVLSSSGKRYGVTLFNSQQGVKASVSTLESGFPAVLTLTDVCQ